MGKKKQQYEERLLDIPGIFEKEVEFENNEPEKKVVKVITTPNGTTYNVVEYVPPKTE